MSRPKSAKKPIPFDFVLEQLESLAPMTRPMFGCTSVYVGEKIVFILRLKSDESEDNGVWVATTPEHHESLRQDLPSLRSIGVLGPGITGWQILPFGEPDFEETVSRACELVLSGDPRIGKIPKPRKLKPRKLKPRK
jgi:hypothetical protein